MVSKYNVSNIRNLIMNAFDSVEFMAFCHDEFPELFEKIESVGRYEEQITIVIDHLMRKQKISLFLNALERKEPEAFARFKVGIYKITELANIDSEQEAGKVEKREDLLDAVGAKRFFGRQQEMNLIEEWANTNEYRLIVILGIGGIGKSSLTYKALEKLRVQWDYILWRDLRNMLSLERMLDDCIKFISDQTVIDLPQNTDDKIRLLLEYMRKRKFLLILDNIEVILQRGENIGLYHEGFEDYGKFIERVGKSSHSSCVIITSREEPKEISVLEDQGFPVRCLHLSGLDVISAKQLLKTKKIMATDEELERLMANYGNNPMALNIVAAYIEDWFGGSVSEFLKSDVSIFGGIEELIGQQFKRLPDIGQKIMYWLAIQREIVSLSRLEKEIMYWFVVWHEATTLRNARQDLLRPISQKELIETLESLHQRSLIEKLNSHFTLQSVVLEYLTHQFVEDIFREILNETPALLRSHALMQAQAKDHVMQAQVQAIVRPLLKKLLELYDRQELEDKFKRMISSIRRKDLVKGYAPGNMINCLIILGAYLSDSDFSNLCIWQTNFRSTNLHNVNFTGSDLTRSIFAETFDLILSVTYSPNGEIIAAGSATGDVLLWQVSEDRQLLKLKGHTGWTRAVAFSPDNRLLASGSGDQTVRIWDVSDVSTGDCLKVLKGHTDWVRSVVFSPDGKILATAGSDRIIRLWDVKTGNIIKELAGHKDWIWSVAFSPDGNLLASGSSDKTILIWDIVNGEVNQVLKGHTDWVTSVSFSQNGKYLASSSNDKTVRVWEVESGRLLSLLQGHTDRVWAVKFSPDNSLIASSSSDRSILVWDWSRSQLQRKLTGHQGWVISIAFSPDGSTLLSGSDDQSVRLWDVRSGQCLKTYQGCTNSIQTIDLNPDGTLLVSGSTDHTVRVWDLESGECINTYYGHDNRIQCVDINIDGHTVASCGDDHTIILWDISKGRKLRSLKEHTSWIRSVAFNPAGNLLASCCDDLTIRLWDVRTGDCIKVLGEHTNWVATVTFSTDGQTLASGSADTTIQLWDVRTGKQLRILKGHQLRVNRVTFSPNGHLLASCSDDQTIRLWDWHSGKVIKVLKGHTGPLKTVAFSTDNRFLASGGDDQLIKLWDMSTYKCVKTLEGHNNRVWAIVFHPGNNFLFSGSDDETIKMWDLKAGTCIKTMRSKRIYEGMNITDIEGLTDVQKANLRALGAIGSLPTECG